MSPLPNRPALTLRLLVAALPLVGMTACGGGRPQAEPHDPAELHKAAIRGVLKHYEAATARYQQDEKADRLAAARAYVRALKGIDLRQCPRDFQEAFLKHREAREEILPVLEKYSGFTGGLFAVFEMGAALCNLSTTTEGDRAFARVRREVAATYRDVAQAALRYRVQAGH